MLDLLSFIDFGDEGPILHFAHANAYPPGCYRQFFEALLPHYRVLAIEQRPLHPNSNPDDLKSWGLLADDLIRFFEQEGLENVIGRESSSMAHRRLSTTVFFIPLPDAMWRLVKNIAIFSWQKPKHGGERS
ncbi:MAG: hypothetical protein GY803_21730 [Chloroflexi bacterium]|nr:hypothetical protein [Chloroflexota bacterium]